jgi:hypothetical protein
VTRRRSYPDGEKCKKYYYCRECNDRIASLEERWGRAVTVDRVPDPELDRLKRRLGMLGRELEEPDDPAETMAWLYGLMTAEQVAARLRAGREI